MDPVTMQKLVVIATPILLALLSYVSVVLTNLINARTKNAAYSGAIARLTNAVQTAVLEAEQTTVQELKGLDPRGQLTSTEAAQVKDKVTARVRQVLGIEASSMMKALGVDDAAFTGLLNSTIEAQVHTLQLPVKAAEAAAAVAVVAAATPGPAGAPVPVVVVAAPAGPVLPSGPALPDGGVITTEVPPIPGKGMV